jgi:glycosyltransferase involved in cell wall biosynthesis
VAEQFQQPDHSDNPRVSIVLATFNRADMLDSAVQAVRNQAFTDWELLIVDDASGDHTPEVGRTWAERDPRIVYIRHRVNQKISRAYNTAFHRARGEYIAMMDDDDAWCIADKLERQIAFLDANPEYVTCGGGLIVVDPAGKEKYRYLKPETDDQIRSVMLLSNPIANSTSVFRRVAGEMVGWYDANLPLAGDRDFWMKMARLGKMYNFPEYLAYYTMGEHNNTIVHIRPHLRISLMLTTRYRKEYPRYGSALMINFAQYLYAYLPLGVRRTVHAYMARAKRAVELAVARGPKQQSVRA